MPTSNQYTQANTTPFAALERLKAGNKRFVNNLQHNHDLLQQINETRNGQWPFAAILSCIDSRTSAELIFDQGLGDIFSIRIAGNIINEDILGSMEYACKVAGSKFIVVLGHSQCGAVRGACDNMQLGNITALLSKLRPAIASEQTIKENRNSGNPLFVETVAAINVHYGINAVLQRSVIIKEMIDKGEIGIIGAMYEIETGLVQFYEDTLIIKDPA